MGIPVHSAAAAVSGYTLIRPIALLLLFASLAAAQPGPGQALFSQHCAVCHGAVGEGGSGPDLTNPLWQRSMTDDEIGAHHPRRPPIAGRGGHAGLPGSHRCRWPRRSGRPSAPPRGLRHPAGQFAGLAGNSRLLGQPRESRQRTRRMADVRPRPRQPAFQPLAGNHPRQRAQPGPRLELSDRHARRPGGHAPVRQRRALPQHLLEPRLRHRRRAPAPSCGITAAASPRS